MAKFKAIVIEKADKGQTVSLTEFDEANFMDGDVTVRVHWSTINYKDGLAVTGKAPVVRRFPMIPGIDFAGEVEASSHPELEARRQGDPQRLGHRRDASRRLWRRSRASRASGWCGCRQGMSERDAMAIGTAGYTAMLAVMALERHGLTPAGGPVLVTGAAGGVGSVAVALLAKLGFPVIASTGRPEEAEYLKALGASEIIPRAELTGAPQAARQGALGRRHRLGRFHDARQRAVDDEIWRRGRGLRACRRHGPAGSVAPFILRGVSLLGIDSVQCPIRVRNEAWRRLASDLDRGKLAQMTREIGLDEVISVAGTILEGRVRGRIVVKIG